MVRLFFPAFFLWAAVCQALTPVSRDWSDKETAFEQTAPPYILNIRLNKWDVGSKAWIEVYQHTSDGLILVQNQFFQAGACQLRLSMKVRYVFRIHMQGMLTQRAWLDLNSRYCFFCSDGLEWRVKETLFQQESTNIYADITLKPARPEVELGRQSRYTITESAYDTPYIAPEIQTLAALMIDNPGIQVNIAAHTNCRGNNQYNLEFTRRWAEQIKQQVAGLGVESSRIQAEGFGETRPVQPCIHCEDCPAEVLEENQRVLFTISRIDTIQTVLPNLQQNGSFDSSSNLLQLKPFTAQKRGYAVELWRSTTPLPVSFPGFPFPGELEQWQEADGLYTCLLWLGRSKYQAMQRYYSEILPFHQLAQLVYIARNQKKYLN